MQYYPQQPNPVQQPLYGQPTPAGVNPVQQATNRQPVQQPLYAQPVQQVPVQQTPVQQQGYVQPTPVRVNPVQQATNQQPVYVQPVQQVPVQQTPVQQPVYNQQIQQLPVQQPVYAQPIQQAPVQPYPIQPVAQYPIQSYAVPRSAPPQPTPEETYRRKLRRNVNSIGALMLIFIGLEIVVSLVTSLILAFTGSEFTLSENDPLFLVENGLLSVVIFFVAGLIYCLIRRLNFSTIFPFDRIGAGKLAKLCVIGLSFSLMSNYVVDMINNTFGLFGIENSGGSVDVGNTPNVLIYFLTVAILPAFVEEFAFRGVVMGVLRPYSEGLAILVSSAAFALMHGNFVQLPFTFCCGVVFAYIDIKCNSLLPSIIIHFLNNGLSVLADVLVSYGILTELGMNMYYGIIFAVTGILALIFIAGLIKRDDGSFFRLSGGDDVIPFKRKVTTAVTSPPLIAFASVMVTFCILELLPTGLIN